MSSQWADIKLANACSSIDYGHTAAASTAPLGPKFLRITDIVNGGINWSTVPYCDVDVDTQKKYRLHSGDLVIARTGATTGYSAYIAEPPDAIFASYLVRLKVKSDINARFIGYYLRGPQFRTYMRGVLGDKSAQPNASARTMTQAPLRLPPFPEQEAIAEVLGSLDDKIELNRRMNRTLEQMAAAIFKAWFVDFEPVKAKAAGATRFPTMPQEAFDALPTEFTDSPLGPIPKGWEISTLGDELDISGGGTPSTKRPEFWDGGDHHFATPKDLSKISSPILLDTGRKITDAGLAKISSGLLPEETLLLSSRAPIGYLAIAKVPVAVNQGFIAMGCRQRLNTPFMLNWCQHYMDDIKSRANGTTFLEVSKTNFRPMTVNVPPKPLMTAFAEAAEPLYERLTLSLRESSTLAAIRDALLPKLLSGEIRVGAAEKIVEEVA